MSDLERIHSHVWLREDTLTATNSIPHWSVSHWSIFIPIWTPVSARNIGVIFDSGMALEADVNSVVSAAFYHIKKTGIIRNHLTQEAAVTLVHANSEKSL